MSEEILAKATAYWAAKRSARRMPMRRAIQEADLGPLLAHVVISEAINDGRDYQHEVAGETAEALLGAKLKGARSSAFSAKHRAIADWRNGLSVTRMFRAPHFASFAAGDGGGNVRVVYLPVSRQDSDENVDYVLSVLIRDADPTD